MGINTSKSSLSQIMCSILLGQIWVKTNEVIILYTSVKWFPFLIPNVAYTDSATNLDPSQWFKQSPNG